MWTRKELKTKAKAAFKANYWKSVLVALITAIISGGASFGSSRMSSNDVSSYADGSVSPALITGIIVGVIVGTIFAVAISAFLANPLYFGCNKFFLENSKAPAELNEMGKGFTTNYKNIVKVLFFRDLYTILWSLLFLIPGIVKSYEYRMIPYLLAENPDMDKADAFAKSKEMMTGQKWNAFVLDLSFIGWTILSVFTFGILAIFYVDPYIYATNAELYVALRGGSNIAVEEVAYSEELIQ